MNILLVDNYDSFTYNLLHYLEMNDGVMVEVIRNDKIDPATVAWYDKIVFSPGPGLPSGAGRMNDIIRRYAARKPMLGVCLGLQAMAEVFGGKLKNLDKVLHGLARKTIVTDPTDPLFRNIPQSFLAGRYHSWVADRSALPSCLRTTAVDEDGEVMAFRHTEYPICGVQFHPESVLTEYGKELIRNWVTGIP
jgi:anthranilate synthase component 2